MHPTSQRLGAVSRHLAAVKAFLSKLDKNVLVLDKAELIASYASICPSVDQFVMARQTYGEAPAAVRYISHRP